MKPIKPIKLSTSRNVHRPHRAARPITFTIFRDRQRPPQWRWHATRNGRIVAESGEGYTRRASLRKTLNHFMAAILRTAWVIVEP